MMIPTIPTPAQLLETLKSYGKHCALRSILPEDQQSHSVSYEDLVSIVLHGIGFVMHKGLQKGDSIAYLFENTPESLVLNLVCLIGGFRSCPLDSKRDTEEMIAYKLQDINAKLFFCRENKTKRIPNQYSISSFQELERLFASKTVAKQVSYGTEQDVSLILYTSGTTGLPKGTLLTYGNLFYGAFQVKEWFQINAMEVFYIVLPLHHINSTIFSLATLLAGGTLVIKPKYSKTQFFADMAAYKVTMSSIVPTINLDLLEEEDQYSHVKKQLVVKRIQIGSAPVSAEHTTRFYAKYGIRLIQGYGSTETSLRVTGVSVDCPEELFKKLLRENSIGKPLICNTVILDPDIGENHEGEICVQGPNVTQGYLNKHKETLEALSNNMFHTGDIGFYRLVNGEKYYFLKGRKKEIIIKGGVNISPIFVEEKIRKVLPPSIRDVVVVGFPHYRLGEEVGAVLVVRNKEYRIPASPKLQRGESNIEDQKLKKIPGLSNYETPAAYVLATDDEVAKTSTGKVQHVKVRDDFATALRRTYTEVATYGDFTYRRILPDEQTFLKQAVTIHNPAFPFAPVNLQLITERATNGFVIGCFDKDDTLLGVLTGFFGTDDVLLRSNFLNMTAHGSFRSASKRGNITYLVSVASVNAVHQNKKQTVNVPPDIAREYFNNGNDFVMRLHKTPKAGLSEGAHLLRLVEHGNPRDWQSGEYIVILEYPSLMSMERAAIRVTKNKVGFGLVESAFVYAASQGKERVIALSRFGELYEHYK